MFSPDSSQFYLDRKPDDPVSAAPPPPFRRLRGYAFDPSLSLQLETASINQTVFEYYTPQMYALYESSAALDSDEWRKAFRHVRDPRPCPPIRFIGVWDTVGSLGAPGAIGQIFNRGKYRYHDIGLNPAIENACHALAIDERRKPFAPSLWTRPAGWAGTLEQVWFPGVHSNVGGSYSPDGLANEALHWMVEKAEGLGLEFNEAYLAHYRPCFNSVLNDSMSPMYRVVGPYVRPIGEHLADGEALHQSVLDRMKLAECAYDPPNVKAYLARGNPVVTDTKRLPRGEPCPPAMVAPRRSAEGAVA